LQEVIMAFGEGADGQMASPRGASAAAAACKHQRDEADGPPPPRLSQHPSLRRLSSLRRQESLDDITLCSLGYAGELRRGFTGFMSFALCYTILAPLPALSMLYAYGLAAGGPATFLWGWVAVSVLTLLVALPLAEICSSYPCAGSVYYCTW
jgi:fatty acid desaturase